MWRCLLLDLHSDAQRKCSTMDVHGKWINGRRRFNHWFFFSSYIICDHQLDTPDIQGAEQKPRDNINKNNTTQIKLSSYTNSSCFLYLVKLYFMQMLMILISLGIGNLICFIIQSKTNEGFFRKRRNTNIVNYIIR